MTQPAENGAALAALGRLVDQAWTTAGDDGGRTRVQRDRATILAALTARRCAE